MSFNKTKQVVFVHTVLNGTAYDIGQTQAKSAIMIPGLVEFLGSGKKKFSSKIFDKIYSIFDKYCPGINEEIQGFADGLNIPVEHIIYYTETYLQSGHCSHFVIPPSISENGHILVGRNYEFADSLDDLRLCSKHVDGKNAYIGFSSFLFGAREGINKNGLTVTMSAGGLPVGKSERLLPPVQDGLQFWAIVRTILEQCKSVDEAINWLEDVPVCGNPNLIIADRSGNAALIEIFGSHKAIKSINNTGPEKFLCATNHFTTPKMRQFDSLAMGNSFVRHKYIRSVLNNAAPHINKDIVRTLLSTEYPHGLCCHYYDEFFGTLSSIIFDLTAGTIDVCFGSPKANGWHQIDFMSVPGTRQFPAILPLKQAEIDFWQLINNSKGDK